MTARKARRRRPPAGTFTWDGRTLAYFDHPYNHTAFNSRRVEVPIALAFLHALPPAARILEIGNVLSHYGPRSWDVVDFYEPRCLNVDVMKWAPTGGYDAVITISTLEHIGYGQYAVGVRETYEPVDVWRHLQSFLAPRGKLLATVPLEFNPALDDALRTDQLALTRAWYMRHVGDGAWTECSRAEAAAQSARACAGKWPGGLGVLYWQNPVTS